VNAEGRLDTLYLGRVRDFNRFLAWLRKPGTGPPTLHFLHVLLNAHAVAFPGRPRQHVTTTNAPGRSGQRWFNSPLAAQAWQRPTRTSSWR
jgi:hypothetical protein